MLKKFGMFKYKPRLILLSIEILLLLNNRPEIEEEKMKMKNIPYFEVLKSLI